MKPRESEHSLMEQLISFLDARHDIGSDDADDFRALAPDASTALQIKRFIDEIPGGFFIYRADNDKILYANRALIRIFGCDTVEEFKTLTGNTFGGMIHPDDRDEVVNSINEQIADSSDALDYVEYRIRDKNGVVHWVEDYGHFVHSETSGKIFYVFIADATEKMAQRQREKAALIHAGREKDKKLQNLIEEYDKERKLIRQEHLQRLEVIEGLSVNYDSILYADLDTDTVLPYRLSSRLERQFEKKLQVRPLRWFLSDYVNVWVHPDDRASVAEKTSPAYIRKMLAENPTYYLNYRCIQNGETQYIQLRIVDVGDDKSNSRIVMGYKNVDIEILQEMKQKQILQEALTTAKAADVAKNTFLSNMSHDMRTPLNAIFGFTMLAKKHADNQAVSEYLDKIDAAGKEILNLVEKVLELSYLESHDFRLAESACSLEEIVRDAYATVQLPAERKNVSLQTDARALQHAEVFADRENLRQILTHLLHNAVSYTKSGGEVCLTVSERNCRPDGYATYVFAVRDTGVGIAKKSLHKIFLPFEREKNTTSSGVYGAGLGLTIAKHLTEMMGGTIEVKSAVNKGSTFTVTIALRRQNEVAAAESGDGFDPRGKKILIAEDNEINLEIETDILQDIGFKVDTAENGEIAVRKIGASAPGEYALILMDIQMPVMDGRQATRAIRNLPDPALANIPILALSANTFESDRKASLECGMDAHLSKPLDVCELMTAFNKVLGNNSQAD